MPLPVKAVLLEIYGMIRLGLGLGQIIGLSGGYLLLEWGIRYPPEHLVIFDEEMIALGYLAVSLRSLFHVIVGIGIARARLWVRRWLTYGWPLMVMVMAGTLYSIYEEWLSQGYIGGWGDFLSGPKLFIYGAVIVFDLIFVNGAVRQVNADAALMKSSQDRMSGRNVSVLALVAALLFFVLIFIGRPVKQGFHKGFYKSRGEKLAAGSQGRQVRMLEPAQGDGTGYQPAPAPPSEGEDILTEAAFRKTRITSAVVAEDEDGRPLGRIEDTREKKAESGLAYRALIGFSGGLCLLLAFLFHGIRISADGKNAEMSTAFYILLAAGFLLWAVYGMSLKLLPISLGSGAALLLCLGILWMKLK